jgi:hypothetical protein
VSNAPGDNGTYLDQGGSVWYCSACGKYLFNWAGSWWMLASQQTPPPDYYGTGGSTPDQAAWNGITVTAAASGHALRGAVTHGDATAYPNVTLTAVKGSTTLTAASGSDGTYHVDGCEDGQWTITPSVPTSGFTITNCPTDTGTYLPAGTVNGRPLYHCSANNKDLWWTNNYGYWALGVQATNSWEYEGSGGAETPDLAAWEGSPAPVVTAFSVSQPNWSPATRIPTVSGADVTGQDFTVSAGATNVPIGMMVI